MFGSSNKLISQITTFICLYIEVLCRALFKKDASLITGLQAIVGDKAAN